jgi:hypothetical protein
LLCDFLHSIGSETKYRHQLRGYLAGLNYLPGTTENEDVLKCLHQCAESLQVPAITNVMSSGMEMVVDSKGSVVKVDGKDAKDVASMVKMRLNLILPKHHIRNRNYILLSNHCNTTRVFIPIFRSDESLI